MTENADPLASSHALGRLFTVGIPVFNGKSLLRNCLQSVIDSTFPRARYEIVIADDGSSAEETLEILREFEKTWSNDPGFVRVLSSSSNSGGAARPRNRILDVATGDYVFFIDSDDTIGDEALERIAEAVTATPTDWVAINQVSVNGRAPGAVLRRPHAEVTRAKALSTLTVHKVFRRAEIERQHLRFDEGLPSGQDVSFAFSYIVNAERFLMLGDYDYYYLTQHAHNPDEPAHLSRRASTPKARIDKNERILRSMFTALHDSKLPESEQLQIVCNVALPRVLIRQGYLKAIVMAGPVVGKRALRRLSSMLADPLVTDLDPAELTEGVTPEQLARIATSDWAGLSYLVGTAGAKPSRSVELAAEWASRGRRLFDVASGRTRHRRLMNELHQLRRSVQELQETQQRLETSLQAQVQGWQEARRE